MISPRAASSVHADLRPETLSLVMSITLLIAVTGVWTQTTARKGTRQGGVETPRSLLSQTAKHTERERERGRERETDRQTDRQRHRQTDRQTDRQRQTDRHRQRDRQRQRELENFILQRLLFQSKLV